MKYLTVLLLLFVGINAYCAYKPALHTTIFPPTVRVHTHSRGGYTGFFDERYNFLKLRAKKYGVNVEEYIHNYYLTDDVCTEVMTARYGVSKEATQELLLGLLELRRQEIMTWIGGFLGLLALGGIAYFLVDILLSRS